MGILINDGISYFYLGEYQVARSLWQGCLEREPDNGNIHNLLGIVSSQLGDYQDAIWHFNTALNQGVCSAEIHNNLGYALACLNKYQAAMTCFKQALTIDDYYTHASGNLNTIKRILEGSLNRGAYHRFQARHLLASNETTGPGTEPFPSPDATIKE